MKTAVTLLAGLVIGLVCGIVLQDDIRELVFREPVFVEYNPTIDRIAEFMPGGKWEIIQIEFYGTDEMEVRERARAYMSRLLNELGIYVPHPKTQVILSNYPGGRTHWVYYKKVI